MIEKIIPIMSMTFTWKEGKTFKIYFTSFEDGESFKTFIETLIKGVREKTLDEMGVSCKGCIEEFGLDKKVLWYCPEGKTPATCEKAKGGT